MHQNFSCRCSPVMYEPDAEMCLTGYLELLHTDVTLCSCVVVNDLTWYVRKRRVSCPVSVSESCWVLSVRTED